MQDFKFVVEAIYKLANEQFGVPIEENDIPTFFLSFFYSELNNTIQYNTKKNPNKREISHQFHKIKNNEV